MNMDEPELLEPLASFSNQQMIEELTKRIGGPDTVSINIFINSDGYLIEEKIRSAESLKREGISMRNVFGQYIKEE